MIPCLPKCVWCRWQKDLLNDLHDVNRNLYQIILVTGIELYINITSGTHCVDVDITYVHSITEKVIKINSKFITKGNCANLLEIYVKTFLDAVRNAKVFLTNEIYQMFSPISVKHSYKESSSIDATEFENWKLQCKLSYCKIQRKWQK